jgi:hypothetical protein
MIFGFYHSSGESQGARDRGVTPDRLPDAACVRDSEPERTLVCSRARSEARRRRWGLWGYDGGLPPHFTKSPIQSRALSRKSSTTVKRLDGRAKESKL